MIPSGSSKGKKQHFSQMNEGTYNLLQFAHNLKISPTAHQKVQN